MSTQQVITTGFTKSLSLKAPRLKEHATLFSQNFGTWSPLVPLATNNPFLLPDHPIKMTPTYFAESFIPDRGHPCDTRHDSMKKARYDRYFSMRLGGIDGELIGHVFASMWECDDYWVMRITQMVVNKEWRGQGIATRLLRKLYETFAYTSTLGILTTNPIAIKAVLNLFESCGSNVTRERDTRGR